MSRLFDDAQSEYLQVEQAVRSGAPFAVVGWFNTDTLAQNQILFWVGDKDNTAESFYLILHSTDYLTFTSRAGGVGRNTTVTSQHTANNWHHACGIVATSTDRRVLLNGGSKGTNVDASVPSGLDRTSIGMRRSSVPDLPMSGMIAETAVYNLSAYPGATNSLKADYFEANILPNLVAGEPASKYPTGLVAYWPFETSSLEDEAGEFDLTASGTVFSYDHPSVWRNLGGIVESQSALTADIMSIEELVGLIEVQSTVVECNLQWLKELSGQVNAQSALTARLQWLKELSVLIEAQSSAEGYIRAIEQLSGLIEAQSTTTAKLRDLSSLSGSLASQSSLTGVLQSVESLIGNVSAQTTASASIYTGFAVMPPAMHAALIDPYSGGAWLWLVEIRIPGYPIIYLARNPVDVVYSGVTYNANNLEIGLAALIGDSSVPRTLVKVVQDGYYTLEDKINATKGAGGGTIKIIRTHEDFLDKFVAELEQTVKILTADSNTNDVVFRLGIPDPLTKKIPLRRYSSKICPHHVPGLFKGIECQYAGEDVTCTGKYTDCLTKENEIHWGGDLGLDPNVAKI